MTVGTTTGFNLDLSELIEEAFERNNVEVRSGYDVRTAKRSLNLLTIEWANRGISLWTIEENTITLVAGDYTYNIDSLLSSPNDTIDIIDAVYRVGSASGQIDSPLLRISSSAYSAIKEKNTTGDPTLMWVNKSATGPMIKLWPKTAAPASGSLVIWRLKRIFDASSGDNTADIPFRFLPALASGLAYYMSIKLPNSDVNRSVALKAEYEEQLNLVIPKPRRYNPG